MADVRKVLPGTRRKENIRRVRVRSGELVELAILDGIIIDDLFVQAMQAEAYRVVTREDKHPDIGRSVKDYLIRTGLVFAE